MNHEDSEFAIQTENKKRIFRGLIIIRELRLIFIFLREKKFLFLIPSKCSAAPSIAYFCAKVQKTHPFSNYSLSSSKLSFAKQKKIQVFY